MIFTRTPSGLTLAEHAADEDAVARALRAFDCDLRLIRAVDEDHRCWVWKVYRYMGDHRPAEFVCGWWTDELEPLPLTMRLVDRVKDRHAASRAPHVDADEHNLRLIEARRKDAEDAADALAGEFAPYLDRGRVSVAAGRSRKPAHLRNRHLPEEARR